MEKTKKIQSIKENHMFSKLYNRGKSFPSKTLILYVLKNYDKKAPPRLGITVAKGRGNAVIRNRTKRKIKEAYRVLHPFIKDGFLIVIVARQACVEAKQSKISEDLHLLLDKATLFDVK